MSHRSWIKDSGHVRIPKELANKILEPYFTTKKLREGTGLGLSISKEIVEDHGGEIIIPSNSEHTQIVISLPKEKVIKLTSKSA